MEPKIEELTYYAMNYLGLPVTIIDLEGRLLYYNYHAEKVLDRKPEYIGRKIFEFHKKDASNEKIKTMLHEFRNGRKDPIRYQARPYGKTIHVTVSPIIVDGVCIGCVQSVIPENEVLSE
jgi:DUF438 domain-containing protein